MTVNSVLRSKFLIACRVNPYVFFKNKRSFRSDVLLEMTQLEAEVSLF